VGRGSLLRYTVKRGEMKTVIELNRQLNTDKAKLLKELDRVKRQLEEALTYKDAFKLSEKAFAKKSAELEDLRGKVLEYKHLFESGDNLKKMFTSLEVMLAAVDKPAIAPDL